MMAELLVESDWSARPQSFAETTGSVGKATQQKWRTSDPMLMSGAIAGMVSSIGKVNAGQPSSRTVIERIRVLKGTAPRQPPNQERIPGIREPVPRSTASS